MIIKTPNGYSVELKEKLSFGEMRELQKGMFEGLSAEVGKTPVIDFTRLLEYSEKAFPFLVVEIIKDGKKIDGDLLKEVYSWDSEDGQAVFDKITEIAQPTVDSKKK